MAAKDFESEIAAIAARVGGLTLELQGWTRGAIPGVTWIEAADQPAGHALEAYQDSSVDVIVSAGGLDRIDEPITAIREWRRLLKEDGVLALVSSMPQTRGGVGTTPSHLVALLDLIGGFEIKSITPVETEKTWMLEAKRKVVADLRMPLGVQGPHMTKSANRSLEARGELYFQIGILLLQTGDPNLALRSFESLMGIEGCTSEALFGTGMCYGSLDRWLEAVTELQRAIALDPQNTEIRRWLQLARDRANPPVVTVPSPGATHQPETETVPETVPQPASVPQPQSSSGGLRI